MTLALYLSRQVGERIVAVSLTLVALGLSFSLFENGTEILDNYGMRGLGTFAALRAPLILLLVLPLSVLVGAMLAFVSMAARNELVVLRSAGQNTVRMLLLLVPLAVLLGAAQSLLASRLGPAAEQALVERFPAMFERAPIEEEIWLRESQAVVRIGWSEPDGVTFRDVSVFRLDTEGILLQRIDAATARYSLDGWVLENVTVQSAGGAERTLAEMPWRTRLSPASILGVTRQPNLVDAGEVSRTLAGELPAARGMPFYLVQLWRSYSAYLVPLVMLVFGALASFGVSRDGGMAGYAGLGLLGGTVFLLTDGAFTSLGEAGAMNAVWAAFLAPGLFFVIGVWSIVVIEE